MTSKKSQNASSKVKSFQPDFGTCLMIFISVQKKMTKVMGTYHTRHLLKRNGGYLLWLNFTTLIPAKWFQQILTTATWPDLEQDLLNAAHELLTNMFLYGAMGLLLSDADWAALPRVALLTVWSQLHILQALFSRLGILLSWWAS